MSLLDHLRPDDSDPFIGFTGQAPQTARDYVIQGVFRAEDAGHTDEDIEQALEWALDLFNESEDDD